MRVIVFVKATQDSETPGTIPSTEMIEQMTKYNEMLVSQGVMQGGDGLHPTVKAKRIAFDGPTRTVIDGPFTPVGDQVAGYWLWQVKDMAHAVELAKLCPNPMPGPSELEIRPVFENEDFGDQLTPDLIAREEAMRNKVEKR